MKPLRPIFLASFLFSFHLALLMYLNSTVLAVHGHAIETTLAYTLGSMLALVLLVVSPHAVRRLGVSIFLIIGLVATIALLWGLGALTDHTSFVPLFIVYFALNVVVWYGFDLLFEHYSRASLIGNIRGLVLTLDNTGVMIAPAIASIIIGFAGFRGVYFVGALVVVVSFVIIARTTTLAATNIVAKASFGEAFKALISHRAARRIVSLYFVLEFFYAWMVLYMAPYLLTLGFTWAMIGIMFSIMLAPFVMLQYGVGALADRFHVERTIIITGFCIAAASTALLAIPFAPSAVVFTTILFVTRIGASIIEVGCESAFFKTVKESDMALIGTLRMTLPLAYIIAPLCGALVLSMGSPRLLFGILAIILAIGGAYATRLSAPSDARIQKSI